MAPFRLITPVLGCLLLPLGPLAAQQREPAIEVFALTGGYFHANLSIAHEWRPGFGGGILVPLGKRWGALIDATTSAVEAYWKPDGLPGTKPDDNFTRQRRVALTPSVVRLWRRDRFSIYAGAGVAQEHERQRSRYRPIVARGERGEPIQARDFQEASSRRTDSTLLLRIGTVVSLSPRVVFRADFSVLPRYADEKASKSLGLGVGYRF